MRLLADECCSGRLVSALRDGGHDILHITEDQPGLTDDEVLRLAEREARVLLTVDKDFGDLVVRFGRPSSGVILARLEAFADERKAERILTVLAEHGGRFPGHTMVIEASRVRLRPVRQ